MRIQILRAKPPSLRIENLHKIRKAEAFLSEKNKKQQSLVSGEEPAEEAQDAAQAQQEQAQILNMGSVTV